MLGHGAHYLPEFCPRKRRYLPDRYRNKAAKVTIAIADVASHTLTKPLRPDFYDVNIGELGSE